MKLLLRRTLILHNLFELESEGLKRKHAMIRCLYESFIHTFTNIIKLCVIVTKLTANLTIKTIRNFI